jgi:hypothetical protein
MRALTRSTTTAQIFHTPVAFVASPAFDAACSVAFVALRALCLRTVEERNV